MTAILLIEDDPLITQPLVETLTSLGYQVRVAHDGQSGLESARARPPDLVILDILLPVLDGWEVCKSLRETSTVPILMLSSLNDEIDRVLGLELGADDYLTKPFSLRELLAHIKALLRRVEFANLPTRKQQIVVGRLRLDLETRQAFKDEQALHLRYKAFELLCLLMGRAGEVLSRAEIFDKVWGTDWIGDTRTLEVHVRWLREDIEDDPSRPLYIQTVRGVGYRFSPHQKA